MNPSDEGRSPARSRWRVLVVEDQPLMRESIARCFARTRDLEVCGQAGSVPQTLTEVERLKPDLVLTDISLAGGDGLELIKEIRALHPGVKVVVFSAHDERVYAGRVLRAGARGYIAKSAEGEVLASGLRAVMQGQISVSPRAASQLLEEYAGQATQATGSPLAVLSDREFEVFRLLGEAKTIREIARLLHLSIKTVETHRLNAVRKLRLKNTAELLRFASLHAEHEDRQSPGGGGGLADPEPGRRPVRPLAQDGRGRGGVGSRGTRR